jgi:MGT family glycosyltransferase
MRRELGVTAPPPLALLNHPGDLSICYTSPLLLPDGGTYDDSYVFVGPPVATRQETADFPWSWLEEERPLVYVSLGTVFNENRAFFRACVAAFASKEVQVVLSLGQGLPVDRLGPLPPNVLARSFVPQVALLPYVDLFVTHAGVNSVHEGLYFGVPLLLVPQQAEQAMVAVRIAELGAGLRVRAREVSAGIVWERAWRLLTEPGFKDQAQRLGQSLREGGGSARGAAAIEVWYAQRPAA